MNEIEMIGSRRAIFFDGAGPQLATARDADDLVGEALSLQAELVVIPVERLSPDFLRLSSGLAGEVLQKFVNYGLSVAILGDVSAAAKSAPLRDFVRESNRGRWVWFVEHRAVLEAKASEP